MKIPMKVPTGTVNTPYLVDSGDRQRSWTDRTPGVLVLADGREFAGTGFACEGVAFGEAVFTTGMTGYQETLTDPSYRRQIVVQTAPHIGNTGMNSEDPESAQIWVAGYVIRDRSVLASNWRAESTLEASLLEAGVVGLCDVDTRALTRHLRSAGAMTAGIFTGAATLRSPADRLAEVHAQPSMLGADLTGEVSTADGYVVPAIGERLFTVVAVDLGIKSMTPHRLAERGVETHVVPASTTAKEILAMAPDGVFLSNGPGDPATADAVVELVTAILDAGVPLFGICFGNQMLGRALGLGTYKLVFGHRGINQPVSDVATGKVAITAHNHGFAVDAPIGEVFDTKWGRAEVSHVCLNDNVVEGLRLLDAPAFSVQYHPEAAGGPHDSAALFDNFVQLMGSN